MKHSKKKKKLTLREFSKKVVVGFCFVYVYAIILSTIVLIAQVVSDPSTVDLTNFVSLVGIPTTAVGAGYLLKSAFENNQKIKTRFISNDQFESENNPDEESEES